jgi:hypothetical protein
MTRIASPHNSLFTTFRKQQCNCIALIRRGTPARFHLFSQQDGVTRRVAVSNRHKISEQAGIVGQLDAAILLGPAVTQRGPWIRFLI